MDIILINYNKTIKYHRKIFTDIIPDTLIKEDLSITPIESMIFDFDKNNYNSTNLPLKGNIFPYINPTIFRTIKKNNRKIKKLKKNNKIIKKY